MRETVLITGASSGLGLEFAKIFAYKRCNLVLVARNEEKLLEIKKKLEKKYDTHVEVFPQDLTGEDAAKNIYYFTSSKGIDIDILVNNAGFGDFGKFSESDLKKQTDMIEVNVTSLVKLCRLYVRPMIKQKYGRILNVSSIAAFQPGPLMPVYYSTKAFVLSFTEALSVELRGTGVHVTALCPGPTVTDFASRANREHSGLLKNLKNASARDVCIYGYKQMMKNKVVVIPGKLNKLGIMASKHLPRSIVKYAVYLIQK